MTRGLDVSQINASTSSHRIVVPLIELYFDSGTLLLAASQFDVVAGATTYTRAAITVPPVHENAKSREGITLRMNGLSPDIIAIALSEQWQGRAARLLKAYLDADTNQTIGAPRPWFVGRMRNFMMPETNNRADVLVFIEHYDAELGRPNPLRYTDADQNRLFPGDKGCQYAAANSEKQIVWPSKEAQKYKPLIPTLARRVLGG